jgi:hypothetical protein
VPTVTRVFLADSKIVCFRAIFLGKAGRLYQRSHRRHSLTAFASAVTPWRTSNGPCRRWHGRRPPSQPSVQCVPTVVYCADGDGSCPDRKCADRPDRRHSQCRRLNLLHRWCGAVGRRRCSRSVCFSAPMCG